MNVKKIVVLGSTGSIGINTLKVIEAFPHRFKVVGLTAFDNFKLLEQQIRKFQPTHVAVSHQGIEYLKGRIRAKTKVLDAESGICRIAALDDADIVVVGIRGSAALLPFLNAVRAGKTVAPANKEAIVIAGAIIMEEAKKYGAVIIPVDSEQSAIFQCLNGAKHNALKKVYLTASGGPLYNLAKSRFDDVSLQQILKHPRWKMGKKITVDSATLMNKGLEIIEAKWLFGLDVNSIEILIHPEAIIHSMVEFKDGSIIAQLGVTDMRLPIQYALTYPQRLKTGLKEMDFFKLKKLTFKRPDFRKFPALGLCFQVGRKGGTLPCVLNAANEEAVEAFLSRRLRFSKIYDIVERVVLKHKTIAMPNLKEIGQADRWAREQAQRLIFA